MSNREQGSPDQESIDNPCAATLRASSDPQVSKEERAVRKVSANEVKTEPVSETFSTCRVRCVKCGEDFKGWHKCQEGDFVKGDAEGRSDE